MQVTRVSAYSLQNLLRQNARGVGVVGYTVRPMLGADKPAGLFITSRKEPGKPV